MDPNERDKMDQIVAKAQASIAKVRESPFGRAAMPNMSSNRKGHKKNDSLDAMRMDFINDFQKIMRDSGETFF